VRRLVVRAVDAFADLERAVQARLGQVETVHFAVADAEVEQEQRDVGVVRPKNALADRDRLLIQLGGLRVLEAWQCETRARVNTSVSECTAIVTVVSRPTYSWNRPGRGY